MKKHRPAIQKGWHEYKELWNEERDLLSFHSRVIAMLEMLVNIIPYLFATYHYSITAGSRNVRRNRKNRNI